MVSILRSSSRSLAMRSRPRLVVKAGFWAVDFGLSMWGRSVRSTMETSGRLRKGSSWYQLVRARVSSMSP